MLVHIALLPTEQKCRHYRINKEEIINQFYKDTYTVDYAIPLTWVLAMCEEHNLNRSDFSMIAWGYSKDKESPYSLMGQPIPLSIEAAEVIYKIDSDLYFAIAQEYFVREF